MPDWMVVVKPEDPDGTSVGWVTADTPQQAVEDYVGSYGLDRDERALVARSDHVVAVATQPEFVQVPLQKP